MSQLSASTLAERANYTSPAWCILNARKDGQAMTLRQISRESGLSRKKVLWIASLKSWEEVTVKDADAFMRACGVTLKNQAAVRSQLTRALRSKGPRHIQRAMRHGKTNHKFYVRLVRALVE